jgi:hypothetical protein
MKRAEAPDPAKAEEYVHKGIHVPGRWREAACGLQHKTFPAILGRWSSITLVSVIALLVRVLMIIVAALLPLLIRKLSLAPAQFPPAPTPSSASEALIVFANAVQTATAVDYVLGFVAILLIALPKLLDMFGREAKAEHHSPFMDLSAAIRSLPISNTVSADQTTESIRLTLLALREEMTLLIGSVSNKDVTDVALLQFCDATGKTMRVRARTANHEEVNRPNDSLRFVAFYVAKEGRNFAEHDFKNNQNPFPQVRVSVRGGHEVKYRSVLYMPILCSETIKTVVNEQEIENISDSCVGVICVHSSKPYRFWRWGDHKKGTGGFADIAFSRSLPYIAVIEQLLRRTAPKFKLEVK